MRVTSIDVPIYVRDTYNCYFKTGRRFPFVPKSVKNIRDIRLLRHKPPSYIPKVREHHKK